MLQHLMQNSLLVTILNLHQVLLILHPAINLEFQGFDMEAVMYLHHAVFLDCNVYAATSMKA